MPRHEEDPLLSPLFPAVPPGEVPPTDDAYDKYARREIPQYQPLPPATPPTLSPFEGGPIGPPSSGPFGTPSELDAANAQLWLDQQKTRQADATRAQQGWQFAQEQANINRQVGMETRSAEAIARGEGWSEEAAARTAADAQRDVAYETASATRYAADTQAAVDNAEITANKETAFALMDSNEAIARQTGMDNKQVATIQKNAATAVAATDLQGVLATALAVTTAANIAAGTERSVAATQAGASKFGATEAAGATRFAATEAAGASKFAATEQAQAVKDAAESARMGQEEAARTAALSARVVARETSSGAAAVAAIAAASDQVIAKLDNETRQRVAKVQGDYDLQVATQTGLDLRVIANINRSAATETAIIGAGATIRAAELDAEARKFQAQLAAMSNPAALGALMQSGGLAGLQAGGAGGPLAALGAGGQQGLGNLGGGLGIQVTGGATPTAADFRGLSPEQLQFVEGQAAARGFTPGQLANEVRSVTPGGSGARGVLV
jgi:hypothetical protein